MKQSAIVATLSFLWLSRGVGLCSTTMKTIGPQKEWLGTYRFKWLEQEICAVVFACNTVCWQTGEAWHFYQLNIPKHTFFVLSVWTSGDLPDAVAVWFQLSKFLTVWDAHVGLFESIIIRFHVWYFWLKFPILIFIRLRWTFVLLSDFHGFMSVMCLSFHVTDFFLNMPMILIFLFRRLGVDGCTSQPPARLLLCLGFAVCYATFCLVLFSALACTWL